MNINIRRIQPSDNPFIAQIIRSSLAEFGADKPGTVYFDATTDHLFELFSKPGSAYFIAEQNSQVVGGAGIYPSDGLPAGTCELVKMYLAPANRGLGLGKLMIDECLAFARHFGYRQVYIETMPELSRAVTVYEKLASLILTARWATPAILGAISG